MVSPSAPLAALAGGDLLSSADLDGPQALAVLELARQLKSGERRIDLDPGRIERCESSISNSMVP